MKVGNYDLTDKVTFKTKCGKIINIDLEDYAKVDIANILLELEKNYRKYNIESFNYSVSLFRYRHKKLCIEFKD